MTLLTTVCGVFCMAAGVYFVSIDEKEVGETLFACGFIMTVVSTDDLYKRYSHKKVPTTW